MRKEIQSPFDVKNITNKIMNNLPFLSKYISRRMLYGSLKLYKNDFHSVRMLCQFEKQTREKKGANNTYKRKPSASPVLRKNSQKKGYICGFIYKKAMAQSTLFLNRHV